MIVFIVLENHTIPPDAMILLNILKVQRNVKYWGEDAEKFIPERFEHENFKKIHSHAYLPFTSKLTKSIVQNKLTNFSIPRRA